MSAPTEVSDAEPQYENTASTGRWLSEVLRHSADHRQWKDRRAQACAEPLEPSPRSCRCPTHRYNRLRNAQSARIFRIFDFNPDLKEIVGCFFEVELGQDATTNTGSWGHRALSYTWGAAIEGAEEDGDEASWSVVICDLIRGPGTSVAVSTTSLAIRHNLDSYLRAVIELHLAQDVELGYEIWIDAICIDQNNIEERQAQIRLMGDIYREAETVHTWFGEDCRHWETFKWIYTDLYWGIADFFRSQREKCWEVMFPYDPTKYDL